RRHTRLVSDWSSDVCSSDLRDAECMSIFAHLQVDHAISYLAAFLFPMLDAVIPAVPSETLVIALGVATAGSTDPRIALLVACARSEERRVGKECRPRWGRDQ